MSAALRSQRAVEVPELTEGDLPPRPVRCGLETYNNGMAIRDGFRMGRKALASKLKSIPSSRILKDENQTTRTRTRSRNLTTLEPWTGKSATSLCLDHPPRPAPRRVVLPVAEV